jgi:hypothetical protein
MWTLPAIALAQDPATGLDAYLALRLDVVEAPVTTVYAEGYRGEDTFWFVVDGAGSTVSAKDLAEAVGDAGRLSDLKRRRSARVGAGVTLLAAGVAATFAPLAPVEGLPPATRWVSVALGGAGLVAGGLTLGSVARLSHPSAAWTRAEAVDAVRAHNAALRARLLPTEPSP